MPFVLQKSRRSTCWAECSLRLGGKELPNFPALSEQDGQHRASSSLTTVGEEQTYFCLDLVEMKISFPSLLKGPDRPGPQTIHSSTKINGSESLDHSEAVHLECLVPAPQRLQPSLR